jgi:hypothetical protein
VFHSNARSFDFRVSRQRSMTCVPTAIVNPRDGVLEGSIRGTFTVCRRARWLQRRLHRSGRSLDIMASTRRHFLVAVGAAATAVPVAALATDAIPATNASAPELKPLSDALVLSGGSARGAFQAGVICALAERAGIADGEALRPYGLVCGSSIGALNAWFVSTGQYTALRSAWATLASAHIVELKRKYAAIMDPKAFAGNKLYEYVHLALAISRHEQAMGQSAPILAWMQAHMDPRTPVVTPMVWATSNMTTQSGEYFYRLPPDMSGEIPSGMAHALEVTLGSTTVIRPATDELLHRGHPRVGGHPGHVRPRRSADARRNRGRVRRRIDHQ